MRLRRNYGRAIKNQRDWVISRFKPLTVHTEAIMVDDVWEEIKKKVKKNKVNKWYVMTPENIEYYKACFNVGLPKNKISKIMAKRYKWMLEKGQRLELHVHLSLIMKNLSYKKQKKILKNSIGWFEKNIGYKPREFVAGWWVYDSNTLKILEELGLKMILPKDYDYAHDYEWV